MGKQPGQGHWPGSQPGLPGPALLAQRTGSGAGVGSKPLTGAADVLGVKNGRAPVQPKAAAPIRHALGPPSWCARGIYCSMSAHFCSTLCGFSPWRQVRDWLVNSVQVLEGVSLVPSEYRLEPASGRSWLSVNSHGRSSPDSGWGWLARLPAAACCSAPLGLCSLSDSSSPRPPLAPLSS